MKTLEERKIDELSDRLGRKPTEIELQVKEVAETEAVNQIDATPSGRYVMEEIVDEHRQRLSLCGQCHDASYSGCPEILPVRCLEALVRPLLRGALPKQLLRARSGGVASALPLVSRDITDPYQYRECFATLNEKSPRTDRFICPG